MLRNIGKILLTYKFLLIALALAAVSFAIFWIADTQLSNPQLAGIFHNLGTAILVSGIVSFTFEYLTRTEFAEMISDIVGTQLETFENRFWKRSTEADALISLWKPFITEDTRIIIAQNEDGEDSTIRSADAMTAFTLYHELVQRYATVTPISRFQVSIDIISKSKPLIGPLPFDQNLIVVAGPGANPLTNRLLADLKGINPQSGVISHGYVFGISRQHISRYLSSPFIIPVDDENEGILDLIDGQTQAQYPRNISSRAFIISEDSCLLIRGVATNAYGRPLQILIIAGHSRHSTIDGIHFALTNADWASAVLKEKKSINTESLLAIRFSTGMGRQIRLAQSPRPIFRQRIKKSS